MSKDRLRWVWDEGKTAIGVFLFSRIDTVAVEAIAGFDYDYICIDLQHGMMEAGDLIGLLQAISPGHATPLVRVPSNEPVIIGRVLNMGAIGVIVPMVNTANEAARVVAACRYAPLGLRSFGPVRASITFGADYPSEANGRVICIPMIETAQAVRNLAEIMAVPGIDAVYVGPTDLSLTFSMAPKLDNGGVFAEALESIVKACKEHGVIPGIHANSSLAGARAGGGFRMITVASDLGALLAGLAGEARAARMAVVGSLSARGLPTAE